MLSREEMCNDSATIETLQAEIASLKQRIGELEHQNVALTQQVNDQQLDLELFKRFTDYVPDGVLVARLDDSRIIYMNKAGSTMTGYTDIPWVDKSLSELLTPESVQQIDEITRKAMAYGTYQEHMTYRRQDGTTLEIQMNSFVIGDSTGRPRLLAGTIRNVQHQPCQEEANGQPKAPHAIRIAAPSTASLAVDQHVAHDYHVLHSLINHSSAAIFVRDITGRFVLANEQYVTMFAPELVPQQEQIIGKTPYDLFPTDIADTFLHNDQQVIECGVPIEFEAHVPHEDGLHTYLKIKFPIYNTYNEIWAIGTIATDITHRKQIEEALQRHDAILAAVGTAAEQFLRVTNLEHNITSLLEHLGQVVGVSHVYVFEHLQGIDGKPMMHHHYEWVHPEKGMPTPSSNFARWIATLSQGDSVYGSVQSFPADERAFLEQQGIQSTIIVPIFVGQCCWGGIGFDEHQTERIWSDAERDALRTAAGIIGAAIQRAQVEATLQEWDAELHKFYLAVEQSGSFILITDTSGNIEYVNPRFTEVTGYTFQETIRQQVDILQFQETLVGNYAALIEKVAAGQKWRGEFRHQRKDGAWCWLGMSIMPITNEQHIITNFLAVGQDITDRKRTEDALHRHDAILEAVGSAAERFLRVTNLQHNIETLLERLGKVLGVSHVYIFEHVVVQGDDPPMIQQRYQWMEPNVVSPTMQDMSAPIGGFARWIETLNQGTAIHGNIHSFPHDERAFLEQRGIQSTIIVPIFVGQNLWGGIAFDEYHTERNWSDAERDALRTAAGIIGAAIQRAQVEVILREREIELHKFYLAVEQSASLILITDKSGNIEYVNPRFTKITGYTYDEVVGCNARILKSEETPLSEYRKLREKIAAGQQWRGEFRHRRKNGERYWSGISILPITSEDGNITHFLAIGQDITDRKQADEALRNHLQFLATLLDTIPSPVFYQSKEGYYLGCNQLFANQIIGLPKDRIIGQRVYTVSDTVPEERIPVYLERDKQLLREAGVQKYEEQVICADGFVRHFIFSKATFTDVNSEIAGIIGVMLDITDRKRSEEALRRGEERFRLLAENARDMIFRYRLTNPRGFEYVSPSVTKIMGYTPDEYYNDPDIDLKSLHPESRPVFDVFRSTPDSYHEQIIMRYIHKEGRDVWIEQNHWQVIDETGKPIAIEGISRDITERMEMEAVLRIQHDLAVVLSSVTDLNEALKQVLTAVMSKDEIDCGGVYLVDQRTGDLHLVVHTGFSDQFAERISHHSANSSLVQLIMKGKTIYQRYSDVLLGPFDIERWNEGLRAAILIPVLEGTRVVAALHLASHHHDEIPTRARSVIEAIVAQIGSVIARLEVETALRESQNNLQTLFDTLDDFLFIFDKHGHILHVNPVMEKSLDYSANELFGMHILNIHPVEVRDQAAAMLTEESNATTDVWFIPLLARNGTQIPVETKTTRGTWNYQEVFFGISRDITERQRAQSQLIQQEQALATLRERERLARELHDTIGQVLGYVNTQAQAVGKHIAQGDINTAETSLRGLISVTQDAQADVRQFIIGVKSSSGMSPKAPVAEQGFVQALEEYLQRIYTFYGLRSELVVPPSFTDEIFTPNVEVQLLRIIQEALNNIRKHAQAELTRIIFSTHEHYIRITVEDDGKGFDLAELSNDSGQNYGMRSMRERAEEVGGNLMVYSEPGQGTKVMVHIPLRTQEGNLFRRVMLVDDHPLFLEGIRNLLTACGLDIIGTANDGFEAQKKARLLHPDVILMDINMPNCNGLEATRLIKSELPDIQIVMLTTSEDDEHLFEAIKSGASGYLLKSLDAEDLFDSLSMLARGETPLPPGLASKVLDEFAYVQQKQKQKAEAQAQVRTRIQNDIPAIKPQTTWNEPDEEDDADELTPRQMEVLTMVSQGMTYKQVGEALNLSERTIKYHMGEIIHRLHVANRVEAVAYAMRLKRERGI